MKDKELKRAVIYLGTYLALINDEELMNCFSLILEYISELEEEKDTSPYEFDYEPKYEA